MKIFLFGLMVVVNFAFVAWFGWQAWVERKAYKTGLARFKKEAERLANLADDPDATTDEKAAMIQEQVDVMGDLAVDGVVARFRVVLLLALIAILYGIQGVFNLLEMFV